MKIKFLDLSKVNNRYQPQLSNTIQRVIARGRFILDKEVEKFEKEYAKFIGTTYCLGVGNGLDALRLILTGYIRMGKFNFGDEILVPANSFFASISSIIISGLTPVLVEPDLDTYNIDINDLRKKITRKTKGLLIVHLYGRNSISDELLTFVKNHNLILIEDNSQAHGCFFGNRRTGSIGDAAAHSFYPTKNLGALGDGGAITTNDDKLYEIIRSLRNYGSINKYKYQFVGFNSRLDEIQAAILRLKLKRLDEDNALRRKIAYEYLRKLEKSQIVLPSVNEFTSPLEMVWHLFVIRVKNRDKFKDYLMKNGIETVIHYPIPPHKQLAFKSFVRTELPVTEKLHREVLSLPLNPALKEIEVNYICKKIKEYFLNK